MVKPKPILSFSIVLSDDTILSVDEPKPACRIGAERIDLVLHIAAPQGLSSIVMTPDPMTDLPVWQLTHFGIGDEGFLRLSSQAGDSRIDYDPPRRARDLTLVTFVMPGPGRATGAVRYVFDIGDSTGASVRIGTLSLGRTPSDCP